MWMDCRMQRWREPHLIISPASVLMWIVGRRRLCPMMVQLQYPSLSRWIAALEEHLMARFHYDNLCAGYFYYYKLFVFEWGWPLLIAAHTIVVVDVLYHRRLILIITLHHRQSHLERCRGCEGRRRSIIEMYTKPTKALLSSIAVDRYGLQS